MTQTIGTQSEAPRPLALPQRVLGVIFSPKPTFEAVAARPAWLGVLAFTSLVAAIGWFAFLSTEVGQRALVDQQLEQAERYGAQITPQVEQQTQQRAPIMRFVFLGGALVGGPLITAATAGLVFVIFGAMLGGGGTYRQAFAVVAHAGVIGTFALPFILALDYSQETMRSMTNLSVFAPMLAEDSFVYRFLGSIDLVWVYYLCILAIGLGVLYRRKAGSIAFSFLGLYLVIALIIAGVRSALGGS
jgi:Yip1 domain